MTIQRPGTWSAAPRRGGCRRAGRDAGRPREPIDPGPKAVSIGDIHTDDHLFALPPFFKRSHLLFSLEREQKSNQKRCLPAPPTLRVWFHQATPAPPPLMLYDPPESWRLPTRTPFCEISEPGPSWTANGPSTTFKAAITGQQCSNTRGLVNVLTPGERAGDESRSRDLARGADAA